MTSHHERAGLSVDAIDQTTVPSAEATPSPATIAEIVLDTLVDEGVAHGHLDLMLVDPDEMESMNVEHMGHDGPTDVLSFPMDADEPDVDPGDGPARHLGDLVLCPSVAVAQASDHAGTVDAEFTLLAVHGVLHILGHDHAEPDETKRMVDREVLHLKRHGLTHPERGAISS